MIHWFARRETWWLNNCINKTMWNVNIKTYFIVLKVKHFLNSFRQVLSKHKLATLYFQNFILLSFHRQQKPNWPPSFVHFFLCFRGEKGFREVNFYFPFVDRTKNKRCSVVGQRWSWSNFLFLWSVAKLCTAGTDCSAQFADFVFVFSTSTKMPLTKQLSTE